MVLEVIGLTGEKQKLVNMGFDPNKTEVEIMSELGYYKIYNWWKIRSGL
jgi:hypothetical protein